MNYLELLPTNVHEDIVTRLKIEDLFNVEIKDDIIYFIRNYNNIKNKKIIEKCKISLSEEKLFQEKFSKKINSFSFYENIFTGFYNSINKYLLYNGKNKIYIIKYKNQRIINLSDEANKKVFDWLTSKIKCTNCKKGFDFQLIKNKIKVKNLNYCHFLCEGQTKKHNYNYNYNYSYSNPKIYYQTCGNRLECLHNECIVKCGV